MWFVLFLFLFPINLWADSSSEIEFKAKFYQRDLGTNSVKGKGEAWLKANNRQVWADEIEFDFTTQKAVANGNVHIREGAIDIWCRHASYNLKGEDAVLDDATLIRGQLVMTGSVIRKLSRDKFEVEEGTYSNCNLDLIRTRDVTGCNLDWKLYGRYFTVTMEEYVHIHDALFYIKKLPVIYSPYFIAPVKSKRQSGFLMPHLTYRDNLGTGFSLPYFMALGTWHDLLATPTYYTKAGGQLGLTYRYLYSPTRQGQVSFSFLQRRFSANPDDLTAAPPPGRNFLGLVGEGAVDVSNIYWISGRTHTRQLLRLVSDPLYTVDYKADLNPQADLGYLRSQVSFTSPSDHLLFTSQIQYLQPLLISKDQGVDRGAVSQLPTISLSRTLTPFWGRFLSYEVDSRFTHFYRSSAFDQVPPNPATTGTNFDSDPLFDGNDYLRTGQRLQLEPRLIANFPMPRGFQFQPVLKAGSLLYHFDFPNSSVLHREYVETEVPLSMYLSRTFETSLEGYEKISHVFQPRVIYAASLYKGGQTNHPFFFSQTSTTPTLPNLSNPRFDVADQVTSFKYMRFELINRFRKKSADGISRFFLLQLSEQYNLETSSEDPRYSKRVGPIEVLSELNLGRFTGQIQASYQLEETKTLKGVPLATPVRENEISSSLIYQSPSLDKIRLNSLFRIKADPTLTEKSAYLEFYKTLPTFFDLSGQVEYSIQRKELRAYSIGFHFRSRPLSCWRFLFTTGRNANKESFAFLNFALAFGGPTDLSTP